MGRTRSALEQRRLDAVTASAVLYTARESAFDQIVFTTAQLFRVPMAMVAVVGEHTVWVKAVVGPLPKELPRAESFCDGVITSNEILIVEDASVDVRFSNFPIVSLSPNVRFYAGVPLRGPSREAIATLCVLDRHPRSVPERARLQLLQLAREAENLLRLRTPGLSSAY